MCLLKLHNLKSVPLCCSSPPVSDSSVTPCNPWLVVWEYKTFLPLTVMSKDSCLCACFWRYTRIFSFPFGWLTLLCKKLNGYHYYACYLWHLSRFWHKRHTAWWLWSVFGVKMAMLCYEHNTAFNIYIYIYIFIFIFIYIHTHIYSNSTAFICYAVYKTAACLALYKPLSGLCHCIWE